MVVVLEVILTKFWAAAPRFNVLHTKTALLLGPRTQDEGFKAVAEDWDGKQEEGVELIESKRNVAVEAQMLLGRE